MHEVGVPDNLIVEQAARLSKPFVQFLADLPSQPTVRITTSLGTELDMLDLNIAGEIERLREQFQPKAPVEKRVIETQTGYNSGHPTASTNQKEDAKETIRAAIKSRQGQPEFRCKLLNIFGKACLVTGCEAEEALEAAHIDPYSISSDHNPANGVILRADIHTLFDLGLLAIDTVSHRVVLAPAVEHSYSDLLNQELTFPEDEASEARLRALDKHRINAGL